MPVNEKPWPSWVSVAAWGLGVFLLALVNTGNLLLALVLGLVVAGISWWIDRRARGQSGGSASS